MKRTLGCILVLFILWNSAESKVDKSKTCDKVQDAEILLDIAQDFISRARKSLPKYLFGVHTHLEYFEYNVQKDKSTVNLDTAKHLISAAKKSYFDGMERECQKLMELPKDCLDLLQRGHTKSGVYTVWLRTRGVFRQNISVFCDMDTDGGGWTVIQRRGNYSTPSDYFYKNWDSYKTGFGNISEEFWLGNEIIYNMVYHDPHVMRFDLRDYKGDKGFAQYATFWIEDEKRYYKLHLEDFSGDTGDGMSFSNTYPFSTMDADHDTWNGNCAADFKGGWWYKDCAFANPNGLSVKGETSGRVMYWSTWRSNDSLEHIEIKIRREKN